MEIDNGVDLHGYVILGDHGLRGIIQHLLLQADLPGNAVHKGDLEVHAHTPHALEHAQTLNDIGAGLLHHLDVGDNEQENDC